MPVTHNIYNVVLGGLQIIYDYSIEKLLHKGMCLKLTYHKGSGKKTHICCSQKEAKDDEGDVVGRKRDGNCQHDHHNEAATERHLAANSGITLGEELSHCSLDNNPLREFGIEFLCWL